MEYVSKMSKDELTLFTSALNKHSSTESTIRRLRFKKCDIIGRMPTNQSEFDPDRLASYCRRSVTAVNWSIIHVFLVMDHLVNSCVVFIYMTLVLFYIVIFKNKSDKLI